jgi:hypothetical protein
MKSLRWATIHETLSIEPAFHLATHSVCRLLTDHDHDENAALYTPVEEICTVIGSIYPLLLDSLGILKEHQTESDHHSSAVGSVARIYLALLEQLHRFALDLYSQKNAGGCSRSGQKGPRTRSERQRKIYDEIKDDADGKALVQLLVKMIHMLDLSIDLHCTLLEALLSALLDHIGQTLSVMVFAAEHDENTILPPCGLEGITEQNADTTLGAARLEGPYLVAVLQKANHYLHTQTKVMPEVALSRISTRHKDDTGPNLRHSIEQTLQHTLLRGVFGDQDEAFTQSLNRHRTDEHIGMTDVTTGADHHQDPSEWFVGQLWEHLGWNILSSKL